MLNEAVRRMHIRAPEQRHLNELVIHEVVVVPFVEERLPVDDAAALQVAEVHQRVG